MATLGRLEAEVKITGHKYLAYLKAHETLLIALLVIASIAFGSWKILGYLERRDQRIYDSSIAAIEADKERNAATAQANADLAKQYADLVKRVTTDNARLEAAIASRDAALKKQQEVVLTLPAPELAIRWELIADLPPDSITATPEGTFEITDVAARETVQILKEVPVLKADLADVRTELANKDEQIVKQDEVVVGLRTEVIGLQQQVVDTETAWKAEVSVVKAQARRGKLKWFAVGYVAGLLTRPFSAAFGK